MNGIIYCYTSPNNKKYVGQTKNEVKRKSRWLNLKYAYGGGGKVDHSRKKYGPENFKYEVLEIIDAETEDLLIKKLNDTEIYWISKLDTYRNGLNSTTGGQQNWSEKMCFSHVGKKHSEETKRKISEKNKLFWKDKVRQPSQKSIDFLIERLSQPIYQYTINKEFIQEWMSAAEASKYLHIDESSIRKCCKGTNKQAGGFIWILKDDFKTLSEINISNKERSLIRSIKKVLQKDASGNIVAIFNSCVDAAKQFEKYKDGANAISKCCRGIKPSFANYYWEYSYDIR